MVTRRISLLGSTGSIGANTLEVVAAHPDRFRIVALAAGGRWQEVVRQARRFRPEVVAIREERAASLAAEALADLPIEVLAGASGIDAAASWESAEVVVSAIVGAAGLAPTWAAIQAEKAIALANKECLVAAGALFMEEVRRRRLSLIPVDSEHNAIFQALYNGCAGRGWAEEGPGSGGTGAVSRLILTASGGPFRGYDRERLAAVTPQQAVSHPKWEMGPKISVDSASLMNKGLEVIEAHWLFGIPEDRIRVVIHPESIVHSLVAYPDGSVLAQLGTPDMRTPIAVALAWPERIATAVAPLELAAIGRLNFFEAPGDTLFPCLGLAYQALRQGDGAPAILNAANEVAVAAFLEGRIPFLAIPDLIRDALEGVPSALPGSIDEVLDLDRRTRAHALGWVGRHGG
ncbi:MAG: 1-deoxy-D-xylulose-5-phosphate reductoisomerase [Magnetococcales bacterium]|nr:1-deoxy-D-xylulose-5-phosphate reductoisomerase [Magnetococcales bacterium]